MNPLEGARTVHVEARIAPDAPAIIRRAAEIQGRSISDSVASGRVAAEECDTMCHMKSSTVRELHLKTSEIVRQVAEGESFIIQKRGVPVAEIRPISDRPVPRMPDREALIMGGPVTMDSGLMLEQDRT